MKEKKAAIIDVEFISTFLYGKTEILEFPCNLHGRQGVNPKSSRLGFVDSYISKLRHSQVQVACNSTDGFGGNTLWDVHVAIILKVSLERR